MKRKHWATRNNYEELAYFVAKDIEESDLMYHLETWPRLTNCSQVLTGTLKQAPPCNCLWLINLLLEQMSRSA